VYRGCGGKGRAADFPSIQRVETKEEKGVDRSWYRPSLKLKVPSFFQTIPSHEGTIPGGGSPGLGGKIN